MPPGGQQNLAGGLPGTPDKEARRRERKQHLVSCARRAVFEGINSTIDNSAHAPGIGGVRILIVHTEQIARFCRGETLLTGPGSFFFAAQLADGLTWVSQGPRGLGLRPVAEDAAVLVFSPRLEHPRNMSKELGAYLQAMRPPGVPWHAASMPRREYYVSNERYNEACRLFFEICPREPLEALVCRFSGIVAEVQDLWHDTAEALPAIAQHA